MGDTGLISFYYYNPSGGFYGEEFGISVNETHLKVTSYDANQIYTIPIHSASSWTFFAITYDKNRSLLGISSSDTWGLYETYCPFRADERYSFMVGRASADKGFKYMSREDALACISFHEDILSSEEVKEMYEICRNKPAPETSTTQSQSTMTSTTTSANSGSGDPWPESQHLLGMWPMSEDYGFSDIGSNRFQAENQYQSSAHAVVGPFGDLQTGSQLKNGDQVLLKVSDGKLSTTDSSFTVAFYFRPNDDSGSGGLFQFLDANDENSLKTFQLRRVDHTVEAYASGFMIGQYPIVQTKGTWTFMAFSYDNDKAELTVFSKHGVLSPPTQQGFLFGANALKIEGIQIGTGASNGDAFSCLSIYKKALPFATILKLQESCRFVLGSAQCGSPKLPLSPFPQSIPPKTAVPKEGQFPWVASLKSGSKLCSASILDSFWLLTSASCFDGQSFSKVTIGEHDTAIGESYSQEIEIDSVTSNSDENVALILLKDPIDFTSPYANEACLYRGDSQELLLQEYQFTMGWGVNGRPSLVSQTLPRYVPGNILTDEQCLKAWDSGEYKKNDDFCFLSASIDKNVPCLGDEGAALMVQSERNFGSDFVNRLVQVIAKLSLN